MSVLFPFAAYVGQAELKRVLLASIVNPRAGGVLVVGERGTGKSTLVRSLARLSSNAVIELPLNTTEDSLVGRIDFAQTVAAGNLVFEPGLLAKADQHILYVDEVNLLPDAVANTLLDAAVTGENVVEREGISVRHPARFTLVGTMNLEEGGLRPQLLDRFAMMVIVQGVDDVQLRREIIRRRLAFEADPMGFSQCWEMRTEMLVNQVAAARSRLTVLEPDPLLLTKAAQLASQSNVEGHRADILLIQVALALAALDATEPGSQHVEEAARYVLPHRSRAASEAKNSFPESQQSSAQDGDSAHIESQNTSLSQSDLSTRRQPATPTDDSASEEIFEIGKILDTRTLLPSTRVRAQVLGSGKRLASISNTTRGHYLRYQMPRGPVRDLAIDATLRAAATRSRSTQTGGLAIQIRDEDLRQKVRKRRAGAAILFVVDASGSMAARRRMVAAKGAIMGLLTSAYQHRDRVGMIAFRKASAEIILPFTHAVALAQRRLRSLPTGGRTPLSAGLAKAYQVICEEQRRAEGCWPIVVLMSDGRANVALAQDTASLSDPHAEALYLARQISSLGAQSLVVNTETGPVRLNLAAQLADALDASLIDLEDLSDQSLAWVRS